MSWPKARDTERIALASLFPLNEGAKGRIVVTVTKGQRWDGFLQGAFTEGCVLLVLDHEEVPLFAFRKSGTGTKEAN